MIQFNLLPDIKLQYIKAQRTKRLVIAISTLVSGIAVAIFVILAISVFVFQKKHLSDLTADITKYSHNVSSTDSVNKILTVQSQLGSLQSLHDQKQNTNKLFPYIQQLTPGDVSIATLTVDFDMKTMIISGTSSAADATNKLASVNTFVDTLKFTNYKVGSTTTKAFTGVVLSSFDRAEKGANFTISLAFDPLLFSNTQDVTLDVPSQVTTRSETEKPGALFSPTTTTNEAH